MLLCFLNVFTPTCLVRVHVFIYFYSSFLFYLFIFASVCLTHWFCNPTVIDQNYSQGWRAKQSSLLTATHSKGQNCPCPLTPTHSHTFEHQSTYRGPPPHSALRWRASNCWRVDRSLMQIPPAASLFINSAHLCRIGPKQDSMSNLWPQPQFREERNLLIGWGRMRHRRAPRDMLDLRTSMMHRDPEWLLLPWLPR